MSDHGETHKALQYILLITIAIVLIDNKLTNNNFIYLEVSF